MAVQDFDNYFQEKLYCSGRVYFEAPVAKENLKVAPGFFNRKLSPRKAKKQNCSQCILNNTKRTFPKSVRFFSIPFLTAFTSK